MLNSYYTEKLLGLQGVEVKNIQEKEESYEISIEQPRKVCICPNCGERTNKIHDYRYQRIKELPAFEKKVILVLRKRRYVCSCGKRFAEPNSFLARYQRMSKRAIMGLLEKLSDCRSYSAVFDNGSSLFPQLNSDEKIEAVLSDQSEIDQRIYKFPTSQVKYHGKKSSYYEIISSLEFEECNHALVRITERVDLNRINKLIDSIEVISEKRKEFYKTILKQRFEKILLESYNKLKST